MNSTLSESEQTDSLTGSELSEFSEDATPSWQEEVSKDGELFYVEEQNGARIGLGKNPDTQVQQENALHGTSGTTNVDSALRNGRFRPIEMQESQQISSNYSGPNAHNISLSSKEAYRQHTRHSQEDRRNGRPAHSFRLHSEQIVTDLRNIYISVRAASSYGSKSTTSLLYAMLGMMSLNSKNGGQYYHTTSRDNQVMVSAILPTGPLAGSDIDIGDILLAINDVAVYQTSVEDVLSRVPHDMEIKLTFQCIKRSLNSDWDRGDEANDNSQRGQPEAGLVQLLKPANAEADSTSELDHHVVLYLTLNINSETARGEEDILYCYPSSDNSTTRKIKSVRGIFTTLADVSKDAFKSKVLSSTLLVDEELVHCAYYHQGSEVLVICVPASSYPLPRVHAVIKNTVRLLNMMHGSLTKAFHSANASRLNHLFRLLFTNNAWSDTGSHAQKMATQAIGGVQVLSLDEDTMIDVDGVLTELEAADFDDGFHNQGLTRRLYVIVGSCIFYKGYLLASHLPDDDLKDVSLFCQSYCLLGQLRVGQLVIWRQVYPTRSKVIPDKSEYRETLGKYFYLVVGLGHSLLCVLLEAGGCSAPTPGKLGPDPLYVNRARATILHLDSIDLPNILDDFLYRDEVPTLSNIDTMAKKPPSSLFGGSTPSKPPSGSGQPAEPAGTQGSRVSLFSSKSTKQRSDSVGTNSQTNAGDKSTGSPGLMQRFGSRKSLGSHSSVDSAGSAPKSLKSLTSGISTGDVRGAGKSRDPAGVMQLTSGINNTLFHYIHLDSKRGILLSPCGLADGSHKASFHQSVVKNFHLCVLTLHEHLSIACAKNPDKNVHEEGILFNCTSAAGGEGNKKAARVQYWVAGRLVKSPKRCEFYVCFHDSAQQDMVELAFRMGFGLAV